MTVERPLGAASAAERGVAAPLPAAGAAPAVSAAAANSAAGAAWRTQLLAAAQGGFETTEQLLVRLLRQAPTPVSQIPRLRAQRRGATPSSQQQSSPLQRIESTIRATWAEGSTWRNRHGLFKRLMDWTASHEPMSLDWSVACFVEDSGVAPSGKLQYCKDLAAVFTRMGHLLPITRLYMSGLTTAGALLSPEQAYPISEQQVRLALQRAEEQQLPSLRAAIFIAYKTAARWSDVNRLQRERLKNVTSTSLVVHWSSATKSMAQEPWAIRGLTVLEHPSGMQWLVDHLNSLQPSDFITTWPTDKVTRWLKDNVPADSPDKQITASSIKRGAVTTLVRRAYANNLSPELISRVAKHKHWLEELSATTIRYVGEDAIGELAVLLRTQEATRLLLA